MKGKNKLLAIIFFLSISFVYVPVHMEIKFDVWVFPSGAHQNAP